MVQAIAHQTFKGTAEEAQAAFRGRLLALARSHDLLTESNWSQVSLRELAAGSLHVQDEDQDEMRVALRGPAVLLTPRQAVAVSMALHELLTNAMKHGSLSKAEGKVTLEWAWTDEAQPRLEMHWREEGGPAVSPPTRTGFGSVLLQRSLQGDLNAEVGLNFHPSGLVCSIRAPLAPAAA